MFVLAMTMLENASAVVTGLLQCDCERVGSEDDDDDSTIPLAGGCHVSFLKPVTILPFAGNLW
jgi:hypothetical protein